jgi:HD-GYP domain-containing protein (c-di-GMP phosphodiesterase class II)
VKPLLFAALGRAYPTMPLLRREEDIEVRRVPALPVASMLDPERPTVVLLDRLLLQSVGSDRDRLVEVARVAAMIGIGDEGDAEPPAEFPTDLLSGFLPPNAPAGVVQLQLQAAFRHAASLAAVRASSALAQMRYHELTELTRVGVALSTERDLLDLLELILGQARRISCSDAGSVYLVEKDNGSPSRLRFKLAQNFSLPNLPLSEFTVPIDHTSLAGYTAASGEALVIADVYLLPEDVEYKQNRSFDEKFGYRTKSMLVIPMKTHRDEVIGVLQLMNRKRMFEARLSGPASVDREVLSFDTRSVELVNALASQAAVAIENSQLYENIERLFEGFVTAAVTAIEARDPTTFGHSGRVATLTVGLAESVDRFGYGGYRNLRFSREQLRELRYAGLLHDFGKVSVREQVLVKEKKLYPADLEIVRHRFAYLIQSAELEFERARIDYVLKHGKQGYDEAVAAMEAKLGKQRAELQHFLSAIEEANEPTVTAEGNFDELQRLNERTFRDIDGGQRPMLTPAEIRFLSIRKGNLDDDERREIESHVTHTFRFLEQIPWTPELRGIPAIAYGHHEKLNGQGYPRAIDGKDIPVQTRMMTISDIFDALTAADRPYKPAVPPHRALEILDDEAREGMLDQDLLKTFIEAKVFELVAKNGD